MGGGAGAWHGIYGGDAGNQNHVAVCTRPRRSVWDPYVGVLEVQVNFIRVHVQQTNYAHTDQHVTVLLCRVMDPPFISLSRTEPFSPALAHSLLKMQISLYYGNFQLTASAMVIINRINICTYIRT